MGSNWRETLSVEPRRSIGFLSLMVCLKIVLQRALYAKGFISVSADEFARGIRAARWVQQPEFNLPLDVKGTWLPFEKYLNGSILLVWPDVIWAPRLTIFIASCLVLISLFLLIFLLFDNFAVAALSSLFIVFQPWYTWLSGTPMLDMYYLAFFFSGLVFLVAWLKNAYRLAWFWAGCCFMLASGFHVQSWTYINLVFLITLGYFVRFFTQKQFGNLFRLTAIYLIGNSLILIFSIVEFLNSGRFFGFLANHTNYSKWYYGGYTVPLGEKALFYPKLILENGSSVAWVLILVGLFFLIRERATKWKFVPLLIAGFALLVNSAMNIISVPPTAAPGRYSTFYLLMISPYLAYGTMRLGTIGMQRAGRFYRYLPAALSAVLFIYTIWWGFAKLPDFPRIASREAIQTGYYLSQKIDQSEMETSPSFMVELRYWEFLAVQLTAGHFESIVFDREYDLYDRTTISIFEDPSVDPYHSLTTQNVRYVALRNDKLNETVLQLTYLKPIQEFGNWKIYEFLPGSGE